MLTGIWTWLLANRKAISKWVIDNKMILLAILLIFCAFFIGRRSVPIHEDGTLLKRQGDSLRRAATIERQHAIMEATHRGALEKLYRGKLKQADSLHTADKLIIKQYAGIIGVKHTPHELELEMAFIYANRNREPQR